MEADLDGVAKNKLTPQINSCCTFVLDFIANFFPQDETTESVLKSVQFSTTGHSLGGWLSQISAFALKYLQFSSDRDIFELKGKDRFDIHPHCEAFDSPGAYQIIHKITSLKPFRRLKSQTQNFGLDISNFVFSPNAVNVVNQHIGNIFLLPWIPDMSVELVTPSTYLSITNLTYTKETHKMGLFVEQLKMNSNPRFTTIEQWVLIVFRNWDSSQHTHSHPVTKALGMVGTAIVKIFQNAASEYDDFFRSGMQVVVTNSHALKINTHSLGTQVKQVIEILKTVNIWKDYFGNSVKLPEKFNLVELECILKILDKSDNNFLVFSSTEDLTILQNCGILKQKINEISLQLGNFEAAQCLYSSARYIKELQDKFISLEFDCANNSIWKSHYAFRCVQLLELFCFKVSSFITEGKCGLSSRNCLILKFADITGLNWVPSELQYIFVDCSDCGEITEITKGSNSSKCQLVYITIDPNNNNDKFSLSISTATVPQILRQKVSLNGVNVELGVLVGPVSNYNDLLNCLLNEPAKLNLILQKNAIEKLELGSKLPSIHDNITIYTEPCRNFASVEEAVKIFKVNLVGFKLGQIVIYGGAGERLAKHLEKEGLPHQIVKSGIDPVKYFQQLVGEAPDSVFELVEYNLHTLEWKLHYNPNLYMSRKVIPPAIDMRTLANHMSAIFEKRADAGTDIEVLELSCSKVKEADKEEFLRKCFGVADEDLETIEFRPTMSGECRVTFKSSNGVGKCLDYAAKEVFKENVLNTGEEGRVLYCFSDNPGMGKSFFMTKFASNILKNNITWKWVFFLELRELSAFHLLTNGKTKDLDLNIERICSFLIYNLSLDPLRSLLFRNVLKQNSAKIIMILDGFDELPNEHKQKFCKVLKFLTKFTKIGISVSTRQRDAIAIETSLGVLSHHLLPIEKLNIQTFLNNIWSGSIREIEHQDRLAQFSTALLSKVDLNVVDRLFLGIPLHLKMLSVSFEESALEFCSGNGVIENYIPSEYGLRFLLDRFIDTKYKIFFNKMGWQDGNGHWQDLKPVLTYKFEREQEFIAGEVLGLGQEFETLMWELCREKRNPNFPIEIYRVGIVVSMCGKPDFLHRSIAEYYVANHIYNCFLELLNLAGDSNSDNEHELLKFIKKLFPVSRRALFETGARLVRLFLNQHIQNDEILLTALRNGTLPQISVGGFDEFITECVYEIVRRENSLKYFFSFAINSFINWNDTTEIVCLIICITSLCVIPTTMDTIECVFLLIHSHVLQLGIDRSILRLLTNPELSQDAIGDIRYLKGLEDHDFTWSRFRYDLKAMLQADFEWNVLKESLDKMD